MPEVLRVLIEVLAVWVRSKVGRSLSPRKSFSDALTIMMWQPKSF